MSNTSSCNSKRSINLIQKVAYEEKGLNLDSSEMIKVKEIKRDKNTRVCQGEMLTKGMVIPFNFSLKVNNGKEFVELYERI